MENNPSQGASDLPIKTGDGWRHHWPKVFAFGAVVVLVAVVAFILSQGKGLQKFGLGPKYAEAFELVSDKISQGADIVINVPTFVAKTEASSSFIFEPAIAGTWQPSGDATKMVFHPDKPLTLNHFYTVVASSTQGKITKDFKIVNPPTVEAVFPKADSEASETANITIMFSRPMVPLTSLDELAKVTTPVVIKPETKGSFSWISTKVLQFKPETTLVASAKYTIEVQKGFVSMDNLSVEPATVSFTTRPLRYETLTEGMVRYNEPFQIRFNQAVDLTRTSKEINLIVSTTKQKVELATEYGTKDMLGADGKTTTKTTDTTVINIWPKQDRYGRAKLWEFNQAYKLKIAKAYPSAGDINLDESREIGFVSSDVISSFSVMSSSTNSASEALFDPRGSIEVTFFETIDKTKTQIVSDKIKTIEYGQKCKKDAPQVDDESKCEKETDQQKLIITFAADRIKRGEKFDLNFKQVVNTEGLTINRQDIVKTLTSYPALKIEGSFPANKDIGASLTDMYICANSPLIIPSSDNLTPKKIGQLVTANQQFEVQYVPGTQLIDADTYKSEQKCLVGQYETYLNVGMMPFADYKLQFNFQDAFEQTIKYELNFKTGKLPDQAMNFYHLQEDYSVTVPGKTKMTFAAVNMDFVDATICKLKPEDLMYDLVNSIDYAQGPATIKNCLQTITKRINLPKRYWVKNYFTFNIKDYVGDGVGHYMLTFTNPGYRDQSEQKRQVYERSYLTITKLNVVEKKVQLWDTDEDVKAERSLTDKQRNQLDNIYWITDITTLKPVSGAKIDYYIQDPKTDAFHKTTSATTDGSGLVKAKPEQRLTGVVVTNGNDSAIVSNAKSNFGWANSAYNDRTMYVYTDRPIYRPSQKVYFKGIFRVGYDGNYEIFKDKKIPVKVFDAKDTVILEKELTVSDFGTFSGEIDLDKNAPLGQYRIEARETGYAYFDVEEYAPAAFKVETKSEKEEYISGDELTLNVDASYYFGAPVEGGKVTYSIASQNYYFDKYQDGYFDFGNPWYFCYDGCSYGDQFLLRNTATLGADGKGVIKQKLDINKLFNETDRASKILSIYVTVTNSSGQSITSQKSVIVHAGEYYLGLTADKSFLAKKEKFTLKAKSVDTLGKAVNANNLSLQLRQIKWVESKRKEVDGSYYYNWEKQYIAVTEQKISTNNGDWQSDFTLDKEGEYEALLTGTDKRGNQVRTAYSLYVYGVGQVEVMPSNNSNLELEAAKDTLDAGKSESIIIKSPYVKAKALISVERGKVYDYKVVDVNQNIYEYKFIAKDEYAPTVSVSVILISDKPEIKFGSKSFNINSNQKKLEITATPNKAEYLPGEEVTLHYQVKNNAGQPVKAELSTAVADMSVLALKGNPKKDPVTFFYGYFPETILTSANFNSLLVELDVPSSGKGGGGAEPSDLAKKKRGIFKDTAFWSPTIITDEKGQAVSHFTLPDNLTTWQIESVGLTQDTKLGVGYKEFMAKKEVMLIPQKPRFVLPGDMFMVGGKVFNQTKETQKLSVTYSSNDLKLIQAKAEQQIELKAGETTNVYFAVSSPANTTIKNYSFIISAKNDRYEDTVESTLPVAENNTYETVATAGTITGEEQATEYIYPPSNIVKDKGGLTINTAATLAGYTADSLTFLLQYPYGCSEQIGTKLNAIAAIRSGIIVDNPNNPLKDRKIEFGGQSYTQDEAVAYGLSELRKSFNKEEVTGMYYFSYYAGGQASFPLTVYLAEVLSNLRDAGFKVDNDWLDEIGETLRYGLYTSGEGIDTYNHVIQALRVLARLDPKNANYQVLGSSAMNKQFINEKASNLTLIRLLEIIGRPESKIDKETADVLVKILENRIVIDSRGAYLRPNGNLMWDYYENPIQDTAQFINVAVQQKREIKEYDNMLRWLLRSRSKDGAWETTNNTIAVVTALGRYAKWQKEDKSDFDVKLLLGGQVKFNWSYGPANIGVQNAGFLAMNNLTQGALNQLTISKSVRNKNKNNLYYDMSFKYYLPADQIAPRDEGFLIKRNWYQLADKKLVTPVQTAKMGELLHGVIDVTVGNGRNFVAIEDFIPAGTELVNFNLATEDQSIRSEGDSNSDENKPKENLDSFERLYPNQEELRDDRLFLFTERLEPGIYRYEYYVRALIPGKFIHMPAMASEMYFPENFGRTKGEYFTITEK
ncbi:MAG: alpha-2-macroglobulin family protein [Candidatus Falkowbacteria bacterium]